MQRRVLLATLGFAAGSALAARRPPGWPPVHPAQAAGPGEQGGSFGPAALATGPSAVVLGNPAGDVTIVEFFDYQCPICRRVHPDVKAVLAEDPKLRLVHKHWPVFGPASVLGAKLALAARWQEGRYEPVHDALMRLPGQLSEAGIRTAAQGAGLDMAALDRDLEGRAAEIEAALQEAAAQARLLRLQGTPSFVIGNYLVPGGLDRAGMREVVAQVRGSA